jgi:hypothetical protein
MQNLGSEAKQIKKLLEIKQMKGISNDISTSNKKSKIN